MHPSRGSAQHADTLNNREPRLESRQSSTTSRTQLPLQRFLAQRVKHASIVRQGTDKSKKSWIQASQKMKRHRQAGTQQWKVSTEAVNGSLAMERGQECLHAHIKDTATVMNTIFVNVDPTQLAMHAPTFFAQTRSQLVEFTHFTSLSRPKQQDG